MVHGDCHLDTLALISNVGMLLHKQGKLQQARALVNERVLAAAREALGAKVDTSLMLEAIEARLRVAEGGR